MAKKYELPHPPLPHKEAPYRIIISSIGIALLIILAVYVIIQFASQERPVTDAQVVPFEAAFSDTLAACEQSFQDDYQYVLALKNSDATLCEQMEDPDYCKAIITKDEGFCRSEPEEVQDSCRALITGNPALCDDSWCKAEASRDPSYCEEEHPEDFAACTARATLNEEYFMQAKAICQDIAIKDGVYRSEETEHCSEILDRSMREECWRSFGLPIE